MSTGEVLLVTLVSIGMVLFVGFVIVAVVVSGTQSSSPSASSASSPTTSAPAPTGPGQRSSIDGVWVPVAAQREDDNFTPGKGERWDMSAGFDSTVQQEQAVLPTGKPLNGYAYCGHKLEREPYSGRSITWMWLSRGCDAKRAGPAVIVSVFEDGNNASVIVVRSEGAVIPMPGLQR